MGIIALLILIHTLTDNVYASVLLNEFSVLPNQTVEIINTSSESADISGWHIDDSGGATYYTIAANTILAPKSCMVISGSFNLNTASADSIRLIDNTYTPTTSSARIIDQYYYLKSPASFFSFERIPDGIGIWEERPQSFGSWNESGLPCLAPTVTPSPTLSSTPTPVTLPTLHPTSTPTPRPDINGIRIVELYPYPLMNENEWIKIHNTNPISVDLSNWYIDDAEGAGSPPKQFSVLLSSDSTYVIELASSILNNDGDIVRLLNQNGVEKDSFEYSKVSKGQIVSVYPTPQPTNEKVSYTSDLSVPITPLQHQVTVIHSLPKRIITHRPQIHVQKQIVTPYVLGVAIHEEGHFRSDTRQNILLVIPFVNSVLTIVSLFIKMSHA